MINQSQQALDLVEAGTGLAVMDRFFLIASNRPALASAPFRPAFQNRLRIIRASALVGLVRRVPASDVKSFREGIAGAGDRAEKR